MPFTMHPDQKPSDDNAYWKRYYDPDEVVENAQRAAELCKNHALNVRTARALGI